MKGAIEVEVDVPADEAFAKLESPDSFVPKMPGVSRLRRTEGSGGVGTRYSATAEMAGRKETVVVEVTAHDAPRHIAYLLEGGPAALELDFRLQPRGTKTLVQCSYALTIRGLAKLMITPLVKGWLRRNEQRLPEILQEALKGPPSAARE